MRQQRLLAVGIIVALAGAVAWACGPIFPNQLLDDRGATLKAVPVNDFTFEAKQLLPSTDALKAVEADTSVYADNNKVKPDLGITDAQQVALAAMSKAADDDAAQAAGKALPEELRLYGLGARQFAQALAKCDAAAPDADQTDAHDANPYADNQSHPQLQPRHCVQADQALLGKAQANFENVLALPAEQARQRSAWAAYMLGRIHALRALAHARDAHVFQAERDAAAKAFGQVRARALAGASDTQGLGVASFGEEAQLYLYQDGKQCSWGDFYNASDCAASVAPGDLKHAIALYAAQAGHGSDSAVRSLEQIAFTVLQNRDQIDGLIDGPVSQRMLVAYAVLRGASTGEAVDTDQAKQRDQAAGLADAILRKGGEPAAGADRLAALCYQTGHYDQAAGLVQKLQTPLASWVKAKLALQKGDLVAADAAYAEAAKAFPAADDAKASIAGYNSERILGEQGVLALARGEYVQAMRHLYDAAKRTGSNDGNEVSGDEDIDNPGTGYGNDMRFVAERVLTVDELKNFVDANVPATPAPPKGKTGDGGEGAYRTAPLGDNLRWLLARRLMRAGRYNDAFPYFPVTGDPRFGEIDLRSTAKAYADHLHEAAHAWTDIGKAQALYAAAVIARENGMEILGFDQSPDFNDNGGSFPGGSGQDDKSMGQAFVTTGERKRYADSVAKPDARFHYRYLAADEASQAADRLPPRSQAFAAVLCKATGWMMEGPGDGYQDDADQQAAAPREDERSRRIGAFYHRYVKQGPYVAWADDFGRQCEEPDFTSARQLKRTQQLRAMRHAIKYAWPYELAGFVVVVALVVLSLRRRRARRGSPAQ